MTISELVRTNKSKITSGTKEWADYNINCIKGCFNNCRYCYAKIMAKRFGRCTEETWQDMQINYNVINRTFRKYNGRVMFPSSHDIIDKPEIKEACFIVIKNILEAGNELLITSKPRLTITKDIIKEFYSYKALLQFRFTITSIDNELLSFWEPNAPNFEERFESLKCAYENGFMTSVSIEPFLDSKPQILIKKLSPYITESIWIGPMNYIHKTGINDCDRRQYEEIRTKYEIKNLKDIYQELKDFPLIRFKDSMTNKLKLNGYRQDHLISNIR